MRATYCRKYIYLVQHLHWTKDEQRNAKGSDTEKMFRRGLELEQEIAHIMAAIRAGIITPTAKEMLVQAEAERDRLRKALQSPASKIDRLDTVIPNLANRLTHLLADLARATRYEIDKARGILHGLVGEKKIVQRPTTDQTWSYLTAELAGDYAGLIPLIFQGKIKVVAMIRIELVTLGL